METNEPIYVKMKEQDFVHKTQMADFDTAVDQTGKYLKNLLLGDIKPLNVD